MKTLILTAHGSRLAASNAEVEQLAGRLQELLRERGVAVLTAFLELTQPDIESTIRAAIADGSREIVVLPYFLAAGRHVREDLPAIVERLEREFADTRITLLTHFGMQPGVPRLLADMIG